LGTAVDLSVLQERILRLQVQLSIGATSCNADFRVHVLVDEVDHVPFVNAEAGLTGRDVRRDLQPVAVGE